MEKLSFFEKLDKSEKLKLFWKFKKSEILRKLWRFQKNIEKEISNKKTAAISNAYLILPLK